MLRSKIHIRRKGAFFSILAVVLFALVGLTIAFNSDIKLFGNLFHAGAYQAEYKEEFTSPSDWTPCEEVPKLVNVKNNSPVNLKVRLTYDEFWRNKANTSNLPLEKDGTQLAVINFQNEDDWEQRGEWYYYKEDLEPGASTSSLFKSVTLDCHANLSVGTICYDTPEGTVCSEPDDDDAYDKYHLAVTIQTSDEDFPRTDEHYTVTIDPNGGTYNNSSEVYSASLNYGTVIDLSQAVYIGHDLEYWTLNDTDTYTDSSITVEDNISLKANWISSTWHTVTVDPNGGDFEGHTTSYNTSVREGTDFTLSNTEPTKDNFLFDGWTVNGVALENFTFTVNEDVTILANWSPIIAQNNRTSKFYRSITAAEAEAVSGDTISLVTDAEEEFTNTKNITLDLNTLNLNGSIINNGTLTLLNGEINNDAGAAVTNNGTLTMGINDYKDDGTVDIKPNYIRLIGADTGLKQNGQFNFYDGFIEGDIALDGGYNDSPFYRKTFDDEIVHFFPFIDKNQEKDCQHAALESSDLAVSKTSVNGDIYYYSIQDNINTSIRTGYKIYIVREGFSTGEPLTIPENTDITIDIDGHTFTATDTITVNGKLTIEDSKSTINSETGEVEYAGNIQTPQTTIINGELIMKNSRMTGTTVNDTIQNNSALTMRGGRLGATTGYVMQPKTGATQNIDEKSSIYSTSTSNAAINITIDGFIWDSGYIYSANTGIRVAGAQNNPASVTISGGNIYGDGYGIYGADYTTIHINGGTVYGKNYGVYGKIIINGGIVKSDSTGSAGNITLNGGKILVNGTGKTTGVYGTLTLNDGEIIATNTANSSSVYGVDAHYGTVHIYNGSIIATSRTGTSYGVYSYGSNPKSNVYVHGGTIKATTTSGTCYGIYAADGDSYNVNIMGGVVEGKSESGTSYGVWSRAYNHKATGGKIIGGTYGVFIGTTRIFTIGENDDELSITSPEIIGGNYALYGNDDSSIYFYDGVLRGGTKAYKDGIIKTIADGTAIHAENFIINNTEYDTKYLIDEHYVAQINTTKYTSLLNAINASAAGDTIKLIEDNYVFSPIIITDEKDFTIEMNGYNIITGHQIVNNGKMAITNSSIQQIPTLDYHSPSYFITNNINSTLSLKNVNISSDYCIDNKGLLLMEKVTINATNTAIQNTGEINARSNIALAAGSYPLHNNGNASFIDATFTDGKIYNNSGSLTVSDSTGTKTGENILEFVVNKGSLSLSSSSFTLTNENQLELSGSDGNMTRTVYNSGSLAANSNTSINYLLNTPGKTAWENVIAIYNDGGEITTAQTNINVEASNTGSQRYGNYGIYNKSGTHTSLSGNISVVGKGKTYGIYNDSSTIIIGAAEPASSPNYGRDTADVSTTNPNISAISTDTGIGVKNNAGKVYYYDGVVSGNTAAFAEEPTVTEHFYEVCTELDTSTTPNLYTAKLFWMRDGQSTCANN